MMQQQYILTSSRQC